MPGLTDFRAGIGPVRIRTFEAAMKRTERAQREQDMPRRGIAEHRKLLGVHYAKQWKVAPD